MTARTSAALVLVRPEWPATWARDVAAESLRLQELGVPGLAAWSQAAALYRPAGVEPDPEPVEPAPVRTPRPALRRRIVAFLQSCGDPQTVTEISRALGEYRGTVLYHLPQVGRRAGRRWIRGKYADLWRLR